MPHKRNPIRSERVTGMAEFYESCCCRFRKCCTLHERDISHSSVERVILPDACILAHFMLANEMTDLVKHLLVYPRTCSEICNCYGVSSSVSGFTSFSRKGNEPRGSLYNCTVCAHQAWNQPEGNFHALIIKDPRVMQLLSPKKLRLALTRSTI